jgi:hypothetical protein
MTASLDAMHRVIQQIHPLNATDWAVFSAIWQPFDAKRKVILTASGEVERYVYFVLDGVQRAYATVVAEFIEQQEHLLGLIEQARQVNIGSIRLPISLSKLICLKLGDTFLFLTAHLERHILQAERALSKI